MPVEEKPRLNLPWNDSAKQKKKKKNQYDYEMWKRKK